MAFDSNYTIQEYRSTGESLINIKNLLNKIYVYLKIK